MREKKKIELIEGWWKRRSIAVERSRRSRIRKKKKRMYKNVLPLAYTRSMKTYFFFLPFRGSNDALPARSNAKIRVAYYTRRDAFASISSTMALCTLSSFFSYFFANVHIYIAVELLFHHVYGSSLLYISRSYGLGIFLCTFFNAGYIFVGDIFWELLGKQLSIG